MRLTQDVAQEADGRRELTAEVFVHEQRERRCELQPAGAEWRVRWLRGTADLNRQSSGTATVRVTAPGLYRMRSVARARDAYVEVTDEAGALPAAVLGVDDEVPRTTGPTRQALEERFGIASARGARAAPRRDAADALADQLEAGCVHVMLPHVVLTVEGGLEVPPLHAVSDKQLAYARAVRASAVQGFRSTVLARGAKLPRANVEEQMPLLAGWVQSHLRVKTESRYWRDGQARGPGHRRVRRGLPRVAGREGGDARGPASPHRPGVAMSLTMISDLLFELAPRLAEVPPLYSSDPQAVAEELAASAWGLEAVEAEPNLIDVAMLGLLGRHQLVVHQLHAAATQHAAVVDLHSLPDTPPALLCQPWLVEVLHPDEGARLFGDTLSLSGYTLDGTMYLLGLLGDGSSVLASWRPRWTGEDLEEGPRRERSLLIDEGHAPLHAAWAREAARYAVVFGLLLEAEGSRLGIEEAPRGEAHEGLPVRTVYLRGPVAVPAVASETGCAWRGAVDRQARGYLTRHRHGPWQSLARWQYVSKRSTWRWVRPAS